MKMFLNNLQYFWTASIRRQLMLGIILVHAVLMSIFVYDLVERQRDFLKIQSMEQAESLVSVLATNSSSWVLANDVIGLEELMHAQVNYPGLRYAMIVSSNGRVLAHTDTSKVGLYITDRLSGTLLNSKKEKIFLVNDRLSIDIAAPIVSHGAFIAWARINISQSANADNLQIITRDGLLYTLLAIVVGVLFAFYMAKGMTQGLNNIVEVAEGIKKGSSKLRVKVSRHDEIGLLGKDFNLMLDTIDKSKRDLQAIMDNSPAVIYVKNVEGHFTFINQSFEGLFNTTRDKIIGQTIHDLFPADIADEMYKNDRDVFETGQVLESEELAPLSNGVHTYSSVKFPLYDDEKNIYAVCSISTDITDRLIVEKEKLSLEMQLLHTQKMQAIGQLTGGVAHDFNNLLAVILGYAELSQLKFGKDDESLNEYLKEIEIAGLRGQELIKQMMLYSRKDDLKSELEYIDIKDIVEETTSMLRATFPSGIKIKTVLDENIPYVLASSSLLSQILMNLCINAKHGMGEEGELIISLKSEAGIKDRCSACHESYSGDYIAININDNGEGIDKDNLKRIFEPFFTSKKVGEGTGMGLSVVHGVVHKLGGHIQVESTVGKGTSFKILLPTSKAEIKENKQGVKEDIEYDFSGMNIMLVDDEPAVSVFLETTLRNSYASVEAFTDSQLALQYFKDYFNEIDVVITDQTMPNLTGLELSEKLLKIKPDVKIILCTGHSVEATEEVVLDMGIKHFMYKPIKIKELNNIIESLR